VTNQIQPVLRTILLVGNYRATIALARELGRAGHRIVVGCGGDEEGGAEFSRYCSRVWEHPPAASAPAFLAALKAFLLAEPGISVVLPAAERYARLIAEHQSGLPQDRIYASPAPQCVSTCLDKARLLRLASDAGVPVAPFAEARDRASLQRAAAELGYPLIVRPQDSMQRLLGRKAVTCASPAEMETSFASWPKEHASLLLQKKVSGRRHNVYFAAHSGTPIRLLEAIILRTDRPDGSGLAVEGMTVPLDGTRTAYTAALLAALGYHGVGCAQFLVDARSGAISFLEINPRIAGHHAVAERAGLGLSRLSVELAAGECRETELVQGKVGLRYVWTYGELRSVRSRVSAGEIGVASAAAGFWRAFAAAARADLNVGWDGRDPVPTLHTYWKAFAPRLRRPPRLTEHGGGLRGGALHAQD
jgi:predicted ATP-grasp superfamily ATP-dependent carboligase